MNVPAKRNNPHPTLTNPHRGHFAVSYVERRLSMKDEWTDLANFLQEMIEKYYSSLDLSNDEIDIVARK